MPAAQEPLQRLKPAGSEAPRGIVGTIVVVRQELLRLLPSLISSSSCRVRLRVVLASPLLTHLHCHPAHNNNRRRSRTQDTLQPRGQQLNQYPSPRASNVGRRDRRGLRPTLLRHFGQQHRRTGCSICTSGGKERERMGGSGGLACGRCVVRCMRMRLGGEWGGRYV